MPCLVSLWPAPHPAWFENAGRDEKLAGNLYVCFSPFHCFRVYCVLIAYCCSSLWVWGGFFLNDISLSSQASPPCSSSLSPSPRYPSLHYSSTCSQRWCNASCAKKRDANHVLSAIVSSLPENPPRLCALNPPRRRRNHHHHHYSQSRTKTRPRACGRTDEKSTTAWGSWAHGRRSKCKCCGSLR